LPHGALASSLVFGVHDPLSDGQNGLETSLTELAICRLIEMEFPRITRPGLHEEVLLDWNVVFLHPCEVRVRVLRALADVVLGANVAKVAEVVNVVPAQTKRFQACARVDVVNVRRVP
jgi:hypothetical protein